MRRRGGDGKGMGGEEGRRWGRDGRGGGDGEGRGACMQCLPTSPFQYQIQFVLHLPLLLSDWAAGLPNKEYILDRRDAGVTASRSSVLTRVT